MVELSFFCFWHFIFIYVIHDIFLQWLKVWKWPKLKPFSMSKYPTFLANILILLSKSFSPPCLKYSENSSYIVKNVDILGHTPNEHSLFLWMTVDKLLDYLNEKLSKEGRSWSLKARMFTKSNNQLIKSWFFSL